MSTIVLTLRLRRLRCSVDKRLAHTARETQSPEEMGTSLSDPSLLPPWPGVWSLRSWEGVREWGCNYSLTHPSPSRVFTFPLKLRALFSGDRKLLEEEPHSEWAGGEIRNPHLPIQKSIQHTLWNWHLATQVKCPDASGKGKCTYEEVRVSGEVNVG